MKIYDSSNKGKEPPTIVADLNGKIIYLNMAARHALVSVDMGDSISKFVDMDYIMKMTLYNDRMDVIVPKNCNFEKATVKILGTGISKTIEMYFYNSDGYDSVEYAEDKRLFSTFNEAVKKKAVGRVKLPDFVAEIVKALKDDLRFAYRKFEISNLSQDDELFTNYAQLSVITTATVIALNDIEYRNPIRIEIDRINNEHVLKISVSTNTFAEAEGIYSLGEIYPHVAMRFLYIASLCESNETKYRVVTKPNRITVQYVIENMINTTGRFSATYSGTALMDIVAFVMDIFARKADIANDTKEEEQE